MKIHSLAAIAAAVLGIAGMASQAGAVDIYASGSSAGRQFINEVPLSVCDHPAGSITHYQSANNNMHYWQCTFAGTTVNFYYSARGSSDGVYPVDDLSGGDRSKGKYNGKGYFGFIKGSNPALSGCGATASTPKTFYDVDTASTVTININENKTCTNPPSAVTTDWSSSLYDIVPTHFGYSDVAFTSFGQTSPAGTEPADPAPNITENSLMVLPWQIVVQTNVRRVDPATGSDLGPLQNLTQTEIEQIFTRAARDWRELGYGVTTATSPPTTSGQALSTTSSGNLIRLCVREFGSGSKAAFDQMLMKEEATEWNTTAANIVFYSASSSGVKDCLNDVLGPGLNGKVGYLDAFEAAPSPAYITPAVTDPFTGKAHVININGYRPVDSTVSDLTKATARPQVLKGVRCGKYEYWSNLRAYNKTAGTGDATRDTFIARLISDAQNTTVIENIPANWAFEATENLLATKTEDRIAPDPATYTSKSTAYDSTCRGFVASPAP
jgi:hypothetical protein